MAFAQVDNVRERYHRRNEFVKPENAAKRREVEHLPVIKQPPPEGPGVFRQAGFVFVLQHEQAPAMGAGVEELGDIKFSAALQATIDQIAFGGRDQMRADVVGELVWFQGASKSDSS